MKKNRLLSMKILMIYLLILLSILFLISCDTQYRLSKSNIPNKIVFTGIQSFEDKTNIYGYYTVLMVDSCEYVKGWAGDYSGGPFITHKGNCKNRIHIYKTDIIR